MKWRSPVERLQEWTANRRKREAEEYRSWFAWYPVRLDDGLNHGSMVWLEVIKRRRVNQYSTAWWYYG